MSRPKADATQRFKSDRSSPAPSAAVQRCGSLLRPKVIELPVHRTAQIACPVPLGSRGSSWRHRSYRSRSATLLSSRGAGLLLGIRPRLYGAGEVRTALRQDVLNLLDELETFVWRKIIPREFEFERGGLSGAFDVGHGGQHFNCLCRIGREDAGKSQPRMIFGGLLQNVIPEFRRLGRRRIDKGRQDSEPNLNGDVKQLRKPTSELGQHLHGFRALEGRGKGEKFLQVGRFSATLGAELANQLEAAVPQGVAGCGLQRFFQPQNAKVWSLVGVSRGSASWPCTPGPANRGSRHGSGH